MNKMVKRTYLGLIYSFLYFPLLVVVIYSFNNSQRSLIWRGFTWHWYQDLLHNDELISVAFHSISIAILASTCAVILGTLAATALYRYRFGGRKMLMGLSFLMIIAPDIVLAVTLLILFSFLHFPLGFWTLLLAHITFCVPFVTVIVHTRLTELNPNLFEAAKDLGATESTIFLKILIPLIIPAVLSGWLISLTLSLDDVMISYFTTGPSFETLPLKIYAMARMGVSPDINALCSIMLVVTLCTILFSQRLFRKH